MAYFVPPSAHFAGIERVVHEIATGLVEAHGDVLDVHVLFSTGYDEPLLADTRYTRHVLHVERLRGMVRSLRRHVAALGVDVLVVPQVEASVIAWTATRGLRLPAFVTHLHGNPRIEEADGTRRTRLAFAAFQHLVSRRIAGILAVSPSLRDHAAQAVTRAAPVHFVRNPVRDLPEDVNREAAQDVFHFLTVARLSRQKGQDILLRALALARTDLPAVRLTLVGSGPDESDLRRLARELAIDDLVDFAGYTTDPTVYYRSADCFVLPSRWEGFGVVLVEALAFGLPLLAADCEFGPADVISSPRIGDLVPVEDVTALAEGLRRAVRRARIPEDEALRREVASAYSRPAASEDHFDALRRIATSRPDGRLTALAAG
ncbi:glycosyltransferase [Blastococcus saxobsidens]|uniref:glycosyltransferase n=1 Tax=Blastococcus saxobsidens TaxID=138336 RepID=UPI0013156879|nr:glycosyltransferase [Blastococcus saxobsidens]